MHPGISLDQLGQLILKQNMEKRDVIAPTGVLAFSAPSGSPATVTFGNGTKAKLGIETATLTDFAFSQLTTWAGIPQKYVDRMASSDRDRVLLEANVQHWLMNLAEKRMIRLFQAEDGSAVIRAFLSEKYRPLDNFDLVTQILPKVQASGMIVKSSALTDKRLYLQVVSDRLTATLDNPLRKDDVVQAGVVISNSEVGSGSVLIEPMLYRLVCTNGLIAGTALRRNHVGRGFSGGGDDEVSAYFSDDTRKLDDAAFWAKVSDVVDAAFDTARFHSLVSKFQNSIDTSLDRAPDEVVDITAEKFGLSVSERDLVLRNLFSDAGRDGGTNLFSLVNAVTRTAQDVSSYDRAMELERIGGDILAIDPKTFSKN